MIADCSEEFSEFIDFFSFPYIILKFEYFEVAKTAEITSNSKQKIQIHVKNCESH